MNMDASRYLKPLILLVLGLAAACDLFAQDTNFANQNGSRKATDLSFTNANQDSALLLTNLSVGGNDSASEDEFLDETNGPAPQTNEQLQAATALKSVSLSPTNAAPRRRSNRRPAPNRDANRDSGSRAESTSSRPRTSPGGMDFANFRVIAEKNIFDPNRRGRTRRSETTTVKAKTAESFTLVGIISYEKGTFAFFDGSSAAYKKALKAADSIAAYRVTAIGADSVKLSAGTNQVELRVGMQMRREEEGEWQPGSVPESYTASSNSNSSTPAASASSSEENEVLRRLRLKKEQE
jgi:hypothetical protein